jgi:hypothetical protein
MLIDFLDIDYLKKGSKRQKKAYFVLKDLMIFNNLRLYKPVLTGSVPLDIATDESDLDITCEFPDTVGFVEALERFYSHIRDFDIKEKIIRGVKTVVCSFSHAEKLVEIFGQDVRVEDQHSYRHMIVESRLLRIGGKKAVCEIQGLKKKGVKTEPAFACYFGIEGDPYEKLYELSLVTEKRLREITGSRAADI